MNSDMLLNKAKIKTNVFTLGFLLWWLYGILSSLYVSINSYHLVLQSMRFTGLFIMGLSFLYTDRIFLRRLVIGLCIGLFIIINNAYLTKTPYFFELVVIIFSAIGIDFNIFFRRMLYFSFTILILIIFMSKVGMIESTREIINNRTRDFLGFSWPTFGAQYYLYTVSLCIVVFKDKVKLLNIAFLEIVNVYVYMNTQTKSPFLLITLFLIIWFVVGKANINISNMPVFKVLFMLLLPILSVGIYLMSKNYPSLINVDQMVTGRLRLGYNALLQYPLSLFGKETVLSAKINTIGVNYQYVDSSLLQYMIKFGVVSFIVFIIIFMLLQLRVLKYKNNYLMLALTLIFINGMFDPQLIQANYNFYFVMIATLFNSKSEWMN